CVLEWAVSKIHHLNPENVISFSSRTIPILAVLRENALTGKNTQIFYNEELPTYFDAEVLHEVYGYHFNLKQVDSVEEISSSADSTIFISQQDEIRKVNLTPAIDFYINLYPNLGSIVSVNGKENKSY